MSGPRQSVILARLSGGPLEKTGVMQGMSGSPVYIDGRLVGAVALAFNFAKEPIAGIRPIEEMLAVGGTAGAPTTPPRATRRRAKQTFRLAPRGVRVSIRQPDRNRHAGLLQRIHFRNAGSFRARAQETGPGAAPGDFERRPAADQAGQSGAASPRRHDFGGSALGRPTPSAPKAPSPKWTASASTLSDIASCPPAKPSCPSRARKCWRCFPIWQPRSKSPRRANGWAPSRRIAAPASTANWDARPTPCRWPSPSKTDAARRSRTTCKWCKIACCRLSFFRWRCTRRSTPPSARWAWAATRSAARSSSSAAFSR